jgi:hypothetical protein
MGLGTATDSGMGWATGSERATAKAMVMEMVKGSATDSGMGLGMGWASLTAQEEPQFLTIQRSRPLLH